MLSLTYTVYLWTNVEIKEPEAESDTHASFESGFRNNSIVQNNNYIFLLSKYTFSLSTSYFLCFETSTIVVIFYTAPGDSRQSVSVAPSPETSYPTTTATPRLEPPTHRYKL